MGGVGSDIAVDAADIALVDDEVTELPHLIALSKRMMRTIKLNITFSLNAQLHRHRARHHRHTEPSLSARWSITQAACLSSQTRPCC